MAKNKKWTDEEIELLKKYYPELGQDCIKYLPNRTTSSIISKASDLKIKYDNNPKWTDKEVELLKKYYPEMGINCFKYLPKKDKTSISNKAKILKIRYNNDQKWTDKEIELLKKYYPEMGSNCVKYLPKRNKTSIVSKARNLNLRFNMEQEWTDEEIKILKEYYPMMGTDCIKYLPKRNKGSIGVKAKRLNIKYENNKWADEEIEILKKYYPEIGCKCIKYLPERTKTSIKYKANSLNIKSSFRWTNKEIDILKKYYPVMGSDCKKYLPDKTESSIHHKAYSLNIKYSKDDISGVEEKNNNTDDKGDLSQENLYKDSDAYMDESVVGEYKYSFDLNTGYYKTNNSKEKDKKNIKINQERKLCVLSDDHLDKTIAKRYKFTPEQFEFLKQNYYVKGGQYCANCLGKPLKTIRNKISQINKYENVEFKRKNERKEEWLKEDINKLILNYTKGVDYCANLLKKSKKDIEYKLMEFNLLTYESAEHTDNIKEIASEKKEVRKPETKVAEKVKEAVQEYNNLLVINITEDVVINQNSKDNKHILLMGEGIYSDFLEYNIDKNLGNWIIVDNGKIYENIKGSLLSNGYDITLIEYSREFKKDDVLSICDCMMNLNIIKQIYYDNEFLNHFICDKNIDISDVFKNKKVIIIKGKFEKDAVYHLNRLLWFLFNQIYLFVKQHQNEYSNSNLGIFMGDYRLYQPFLYNMLNDTIPLVFTAPDILGITNSFQKHSDDVLRTCKNIVCLNVFDDLEFTRLTDIIEKVDHDPEIFNLLSDKTFNDIKVLIKAGDKPKLEFNSIVRSIPQDEDLQIFLYTQAQIKYMKNMEKGYDKRSIQEIFYDLYEDYNTIYR